MDSSNIDVLVIDDDPAVLEVIHANLEACGYSVSSAETGRAGINLFRKRGFDVVIVDIMLPDLRGEEVVETILGIDEETIILVITGFPSVDGSLEMLRIGAEDYFPKPINFQHLNLVIGRALEQRRLRLEHSATAVSAGRRDSCCELVGSSVKMNQVYRQIETLAVNDMTVLIQGETGTGKELAARAIHQLGPRREKPFIAVNCGSLPESLLESELFGHTKGTFTGAMEDRVGLFSAARGGTILLDEIEMAPQHTQVSLLRVLDRKEVMPVGARHAIPLDVRVVVTSNKDLETMVAEGGFRDDLFYRVTEATTFMPALREIIEDIPLLACSFLAKAGKPGIRKMRSVSPRSLALLTKHSWPGNVRELKHIVLSALTSTPNSVLRPADLPAKLKRHVTAKRPLKMLREKEKEHLIEAFQRCSYNKAEASRLLGVSRNTFYSLMRKHGIPTPSDTNASKIGMPAGGA